jgi:hypothetical protein
MSGFRGSDEALDREIAAIEGIAKVRVRRVSAELREIERDLRELRRERARRRADAAGMISEPSSEEVGAH